MLSKAFHQHERQLLHLNYMPVRETVFISYRDVSFTRGDSINVVVVSVARPVKNQPYEIF
jgi:hypothetical protein